MSHSPIRRSFNRTPTPKAKFANHKITTARDKTISAVGGNRETAVKASASVIGDPKDITRTKSPNTIPLKGKGIVDSGCSRYMTRNKAYLVEYQDFIGGTVSFGGSKGQITVLQMCDKKNKVFFTDTECLVLSPNFKLPDENHVLLRVPRQNNMNSFNLKNIVPSGGLACLIAKATVDESNKWYRRCDNGIEFKNGDIIELCASKGIKREYSNPRTPQQNKVAKRKNRTLIEAAKTMLADSFLPNTFWAEAVSTACYVLNRVLVTKPQNKTPYELITENKANKIIGPKEANNSACTQDTIHAGNSKMEAKHVQEYYVLPLWSSYTSTIKSSEAKNGDEKLIGDTGSKRNKEPVDQEDQAFLEELESLKRQAKEADDAAKTLRKTFAKSTENYVNTASTPVNTASTPVNTASPLINIPTLKDIYEVLNDRIFTSASYDDEGVVADFTNLESSINIKPKKISQALKDESWVDVMQEELLQFKTQQGHKQEEGIDYDEVFALVAMIEAIKIFLAFASYMGFIVYQMDVKSAFLYGKINKEVYVSQPLGFIDAKFLKKVYKVVKALYGLHQAPRAWYATLSTFLVQSGYRRGLIDKTQFIKKDKKDIMLVQVYVDDIIFGSTKKSWCDEFEALMKSRCQMSSMEILKKFNCMSVKTASTPIETKKPLVKDVEAAHVDVHLYRSMIGSLMYLTASRLDIIESLGISKANQHWVFGILESWRLTWKATKIVTMLGQILTGNLQHKVVNFLAGDLFYDSV
nr:retrovirus-related Pol polyprotein from transposon TNT 1-94 [Tanacetum cinerariifolium]